MNWKTTIIGIITGVFVAVEPIIVSGSFSWLALAKGAGIALIGILAKDFDAPATTVTP